MRLWVGSVNPAWLYWDAYGRYDSHLLALYAVVLRSPIYQLDSEKYKTLVRNAWRQTSEVGRGHHVGSGATDVAGRLAAA